MTDQKSDTKKKGKGYAEKYKERRRLSRKYQPFGTRVLTWPEIWAIEWELEKAGE